MSEVEDNPGLLLNIGITMKLGAVVGGDCIEFEAMSTNELNDALAGQAAPSIIGIVAFATLLSGRSAGVCTACRRQPCLPRCSGRWYCD